MEITWQGSRLLFIVVAATALLSVVLTDVASAAFPGRPGLIAFEHRDSRNGDYEIWASRGRDAQIRKLTRNGINDMDPAFSPNGRLIAFSSWRGGAVEIYVMRPDGSGVRQVTSGSPRPWADVQWSRADPAFSANGRWIAFTEYVSSYHSEGSQVSRVNLDGSNHEVLAHDASKPALSPNGRIMAFQRDNNLWTARVDGSRKRLFVTRSDSYYPDFSPNGRWIVYASGRRCGDGNYGSGLFAKRPGGSRERKVLLKCRRELFHPAFSPNGGVIVFQRGSDQTQGVNPSLGETLFNGGRLPFGGAPDPGGPFNADPSWQPLPRRR